MKRRTVLTGLVAMPALLLKGAGAMAQAFPTRPLKMVVPFSPGGGADFLARAISEALSRRLGQTVIVENKPGGGATIGALAVATAPPDGYTMLYGTPGPQMVNPHLMDKVPYDPIKDFASITPLGRFTNVLAVHPGVPAKDINELIAYARANPGALNFASAGIGASSHLTGELFKSLTQIDIRHVPYKGTGPATQDLLAGNVQMAFDSVIVYLPHIKSGGLRPLGVTDPEPSPLLADVPAVARYLPGFSASAENYITTRAGTPREIILRLNHDINEILKTPDMRDKMLAAGIAPTGGTPEQLDALIASESDKWQRVIKISGAKAQ